MVAKSFQGSRSKAFLACSSGPALPRMRSFATVCVPECYFPVTRSKYMHRTSELSTSMLDFLVGDIHAERIHCFCYPHTHSRTSKEGRSLFARDGKVKPQRSINVSLNLDLVCKVKRHDGLLQLRHVRTAENLKLAQSCLKGRCISKMTNVQRNV